MVKRLSIMLKKKKSDDGMKAVCSLNKRNKKRLSSRTDRKPFLHCGRLLGSTVILDIKTTSGVCSSISVCFPLLPSRQEKGISLTCTLVNLFSETDKLRLGSNLVCESFQWVSNYKKFNSRSPLLPLNFYPQKKSISNRYLPLNDHCIIFTVPDQLYSIHIQDQDASLKSIKPLPQNSFPLSKEMSRQNPVKNMRAQNRIHNPGTATFLKDLVPGGIPRHMFDTSPLYLITPSSPLRTWIPGGQWQHSFWTGLHRQETSLNESSSNRYLNLYPLAQNMKSQGFLCLFPPLGSWHHSLSIDPAFIFLGTILLLVSPTIKIIINLQLLYLSKYKILYFTISYTFNKIVISYSFYFIYIITI